MTLAITYRRSGDPAEILEVTDIGEPSAARARSGTGTGQRVPDPSR